MSKLLLKSFEIKGYRCFDHLNIANLGRVNLIVGKNNVGKSALLEALWIYTQRATPSVLTDLLQTREDAPDFLRRNNLPEQLRLFDDTNSAIRHLFYNRPSLGNQKLSDITMGPDKKSNRLDLRVVWGISESVNEDGTVSRKFYSSDDKGIPKDAIPFLEVKFSGEIVFLNRLESVLRRIPAIRGVDPNSRILCVFLTTSGLKEGSYATIWDKISLFPQLKEQVKEALRIIHPDFLELSFVGSSERLNQRTPFALIQNQEEPISLKSLGEGMNRLLGIALALVNSRNGVLLIDEIESGLHYSVLPDIWKLIFRTARELNVQVFATTHSYDCIEAFSESAINDQNSEGALLRLARSNNHIKSFTFNETQLETIAKEKIEVR